MSCDKERVTIISLNFASQCRVEPTEMWCGSWLAGRTGEAIQVLKAPVLKVVYRLGGHWYDNCTTLNHILHVKFIDRRNCVNRWVLKT